MRPCLPGPALTPAKQASRLLRHCRRTALALPPIPGDFVPGIYSSDVDGVDREIEIVLVEPGGDGRSTKAADDGCGEVGKVHRFIVRKPGSGHVRGAAWPGEPVQFVGDRKSGWDITVLLAALADP